MVIIRKFFLLLWVKVLVIQGLFGQVNLVINPGFEDTIPFVQGPVALQSMIPPWFVYQPTPDYYNQMYSITAVFSRDSVAGVKTCIPHTGFGFVGAFLMVKSVNGQEYFGGKLSSSMKSNRRYCIEYFLKRATPVYGTESWASDGFGIYFMKDSSTSAGWETPPYIPQIKNPDGNVIYDTTWIAMGGSFIAQGGERFFIVGNFKDADETVFDPPSQYASTYYFFDDFSVWYCDSTTITEVEIDPMLPHQHLPPDTADQNPELPLIIPNLLSDYGNSTWQIGNLPPHTEVTLYNALGQLVYHTVSYASNLNAAALAAGMYFYEVTPAGSERRRGKLVVIR
jgi:hypothetical protein